MAAKKKPAKKAIKRTVKKPARKSAPTGAELLTERLKKKYGARICVLQDEVQALAQVKEYIPSGMDVIDNFLLARGGAPVGRITEIIGEEASGKTALLYRWLGCVQRMGGVAALGDVELSFDDERARVHGVDISQLVMEQPANLEEALEMIKDTVGYHNPKHGPLLVGLDSIAGLNTKKGIGMAVGEAEVGAVARILSDELRDMGKLLTAHRAHLICINQIRHKIGKTFGSNLTTPGGRALGFYASSRLQFFGGKGIKVKGQHVGKVVTLVAIKSRMASPFRKVRLRFDYATGYNNAWSTLEHAKTLGLIKPRTRKGERVQPTYLEALEALDWDVNPIGMVGLENSDLSGEVSDDDDEEAADDEDEEEHEEDEDDG